MSNLVLSPSPCKYYAYEHVPSIDPHKLQSENLKTPRAPKENVTFAHEYKYVSGLKLFEENAGVL